jgi:hypothetical protein
MAIRSILWSFWYIFPVLMCCTKKNLTTQILTEEFFLPSQPSQAPETQCDGRRDEAQDDEVRVVVQQEEQPRTRRPQTDLDGPTIAKEILSTLSLLQTFTSGVSVCP